MANVGKLLLFIVLASLGGSSQQPSPAVGPPAIELPFDRIRAEATFEVASVVTIGSSSDRMWAVGGGAALVGIDPSTNVAAAPVTLDGSPCRGMASDVGAVWVPLCGEHALARVDMKSGAVTRTGLLDLVSPAGSAATGVGSIWVLVDLNGTVLRVDPETGQPVAAVHAPRGSTELAFGVKALWIAATAANQVIRVNPYTNLIEKAIAVGKTPHAITIGEDAVWVLNDGDGTVTRLDPAANRASATIDVGLASGGGFIAAGEGSVWVSARRAPLVRIDTRTNRVVQRFSGEGGGPIAVGHRSLWMAVSDTTVWRVDPRFVAALR